MGKPSLRARRNRLNLSLQSTMTLELFKKIATEELRKTKSRLNEIFDVYEGIEKSIYAFEKYSYQF